jgi:hypothetical protein
MGESTFVELMGPELVQDEELEAGVKLAAHDLFLRLQGTFSAPAYITLEEVRDATGFDGQRTADAMAISLYRSRGKALWGFEMKVSRNDWLKELKQPEKAESIMRYCNYWALVIPDKSIVKDGELPPTWGMYIAQKNRLKCVVPPPKLDPIPMSMTMLTALVYAVSQRQSKADIAALQKAHDEGYDSGKKSTHHQDYEKYYKELREKIDAFEKASGLSIQYGWEKPEKLGKAVRVLLDGDAEISRLLQQAKYGVQSAERLKESLEKHVQILESVVQGNVKPGNQDEED